MSYFFATSGRCLEKNVSLANYFDHVTNGASSSTIGVRGVNVTYYEESKKIEDIYIRDDKTGSWMLLVGMPILDNPGQRASVLREFMRNPIATLNTEINGHYCLFAFDANSDIFYVATDSNSFIPIFYHVVDGNFIISSSELGLAKITNAKIDSLGFAQSISLGVVWGGQTRFKEIRKLHACELLSIDLHAGHSIQRYWCPENEDLWCESDERIFEKWVDIAASGLKQMVQQAGNTQVTADITGGEDSRIVLALCHFLGISVSSLRVRGFSGDSDVRIAKEISERLGVKLDVELYREVELVNLKDKYVDIALETDGYGSIFTSLTRHYTDKEFHGPRELRALHLCGVPGGEVFRGSYYLRAKLLAPAMQRNFDIPFFIRMKFLLDHLSGLFHVSNKDFLEVVDAHVSDALSEVDRYPAGIKVDHILRTLQVCVFGLSVRQPFYLPLGLRDITKSIYSVSPNLKRGGRLTKACTERLYSELAWIKTQKGVPSVRRTILRGYLFLPEYYAQLKAITGGVQRRVLHLNQDSTKLGLRHLSRYHSEIIKYILTEGESGEWFKSPETMSTGYLYDTGQISTLLDHAKRGECNYVDILGRIINAELAMQYVSRQD